MEMMDERAEERLLEPKNESRVGDRKRLEGRSMESVTENLEEVSGSAVLLNGPKAGRMGRKGRGSVPSALWCAITSSRERVLSGKITEAVRFALEKPAVLASLGFRSSLISQNYQNTPDKEKQKGVHLLRGNLLDLNMNVGDACGR